ncbi:MAG: dioxygenase [Clostridia bacterium]|nr:dioxygenase [Clostridia bacterium]
MSNQKGQVIYCSHGGGPLPILGDASHEKMVTFMEKLPNQLHRPEAIVLFSAHWEAPVITIQNNAKPELLYDYYGFPNASYNLKYPCRLDQELASRIGLLLEKASIEFKYDEKRPYDHGMFIPLLLMYPEADIPVIQVSLKHNLSPSDHLNLGKALQPLLEENILFIGSGFSFHNMGAFDFSGQDVKDPANDAFQEAITHLCCDNLSKDEKWHGLLNWTTLEGARYCHPREEHLLPLHICVGLSQSNGNKIFDDYIIGKRAIAILW